MQLGRSKKSWRDWN